MEAHTCLGSVLALLLVQERLVQERPPATPAPLRVERDVVYGTAEGVELKLDAYLPEGEGSFPAVLCIHGGAWMAGAKEEMGPSCERLARLGFAAFSVDYRLAPKHVFPAQLEDCVHALQYIRMHATDFGIDKDRIGAMGPSAGGHIVALMGVLDERRDESSADPVRRESTRLQCAASYYGPTLLTKRMDYDFDTLPPPEVFGPEATDAAYADASPVNFVGSDDPPFLFVHGDKDDSVVPEHSFVMHERLSQAGVNSEVFLVEGGGHGDFWKKDPDGEHWQRTVQFFAEHLKASGPPSSSR